MGHCSALKVWTPMGAHDDGDHALLARLHSPSTFSSLKNTAFIFLPHSSSSLSLPFQISTFQSSQFYFIIIFIARLNSNLFSNIMSFRPWLCVAVDFARHSYQHAFYSNNSRICHLIYGPLWLIVAKKLVCDCWSHRGLPNKWQIPIIRHLLLLKCTLIAVSSKIYAHSLLYSVPIMYAVCPVLYDKTSTKEPNCVTKQQ